jgi:hypothetical protein
VRWKNLRIRVHLGNPGVDWKIILKISVHEQGVRVYGIDSRDSGESPVRKSGSTKLIYNGAEINKRTGKKTYTVSLGLRKCLVI